MKFYLFKISPHYETISITGINTCNLPMHVIAVHRTYVADGRGTSCETRRAFEARAYKHLPKPSPERGD